MEAKTKERGFDILDTGSVAQPLMLHSRRYKKSCISHFRYSIISQQNHLLHQSILLPQVLPTSSFMFIVVIAISGYLAVLVIISIPKQLAEISAARRDFTRQLSEPETDDIFYDAISWSSAHTPKTITKTDSAALKSATANDKWYAIQSLLFII